MEGRVQIISKEMMKPTSQTSHPLKKMKFSYIDRLLPSIYIPLIFFYKADESTGLTPSNHLQISQRLKHSLLDTLPSFFPLAGRLKHNDGVDWDGSAGVEFIVTRIHAQLNDVVQQSDVEELKQYIPSECTTFNHGQRLPLLVVQITFFECGGLAVAVCISHKVSDFASAMAFLNAWAAKCRGEPEASLLSFGTHPYFPAFGLIPFSIFSNFFKSNDEFLTKKFVFKNETLEVLKQLATSSSESPIKDPSRVELVSAFIWKHFIACKSKNLQARKIFAAIMAVNLRPRTSPPGLLENVFGNCIMSPLAFAHSSGKFHHLIDKLRRSIRRVKGDYITKPLNKESYMKELVKLGILLITGKLEWCFFTSWRGFPVYEVDYGWGRPVWFSTPSMPIKNLVVLVSSKSGDDIEAIVTMKKEELQMLEAQISLISTKM